MWRFVGVCGCVCVCVCVPSNWQDYHRYVNFRQCYSASPTALLQYLFCSHVWLMGWKELRNASFYSLLTYFILQSPSWEANWFTASQEIPRISRNPKLHYRTHKRLPPVSILGQPNPVHIHTSHLLEFRSNIIRPSTPRSPQWSPSLRWFLRHEISAQMYILICW